MARTSRELKTTGGRVQVESTALAELVALARHRDVGLRAAMRRAQADAHDAEAAVRTCEQACETQRRRWRECLSRGGVYARREAVEALRRVEAARVALGDAASRHAAALAHAQQARTDVIRLHEQLQANARKQEKFRELSKLYRR
ncbi:hypothetical protein LV28_18665 [Pandoraea pnomenusa]|uniref:Uncharacterized protein n=1 Tax=Pandoraea pnomenusa TaxID=93220 RepID=A0A378YUW6_9BURK|nr:hypothetical protein [Pandoraea pnomenusa]AIU28321.2 hypothetical protein LV28_18665 [Pandoraea pnomenusa]SUA80330.1 Uncharacterised protein [Pandoraea pnomenusa]